MVGKGITYRAAALAMLAVLSACGKTPSIEAMATDNAHISIDMLFTHNGIRMYRFYDGGRAIYFTDPSADVVEHHSESCGKHCMRKVETRTIPVQVPR